MRKRSQHSHLGEIGYLHVSVFILALCYMVVCHLIYNYTELILYWEGLDTTIAATVQASVYEDLGDLQKLPWIGIGFPLGSVAMVLLIGKLFDTFDIKWLNIGSVLLFEIGSAICGAAPTSDAIIIGRVIAGIGGSGMYIGYAL
jgi:MFS family permease